MFMFLSVFIVAVTAQVDTTAVSIGDVVDQVKDVASAIVGKDLTFKIILIAAIAGALGHAFQDTYKGVKTSPDSPFKFVLRYWVNPNLDTNTLIPSSALLYATPLTGNEAGISDANSWNRSATVTKNQSSTWQNGAILK